MIGSVDFTSCHGKCIIQLIVKLMEFCCNSVVQLLQLYILAACEGLVCYTTPRPLIQ